MRVFTPSPPTVIPRAALILLRTDPRVVVVHGPIGFGKSSIVADWLDGRYQPESIHWFSARDADELQSRLYARVSGWLSPEEGAQDAEPLVLVIDDVHLTNTEFPVLMVEFARLLPALRLIIISRTNQELVARIVLQDPTAVIIGRSELRMTAADIQTLAAALGRRISDADVARLAAAVGGWPVLIRRVLDESSDEEALPLTAAHALLHSGIAPQITDQEGLRLFARFALAGRLTHRLIRSIADPDQAARLFAMFGSDDSSGLRYQRDDVELQIPVVIRDFARSLVTRDEPQLAQTAHRQFGRWYFEHPGPGHLGLALEHAAAGGDWELVERLWRAHSAELTQVHTRSLVALLALAPAALHADRPDLRFGLDLAASVEQIPDNGEINDRASVLNTYIRVQHGTSETVGDMSAMELVTVGVGHLIALRLKGEFAKARRFATGIGARFGTSRLHRSNIGDRGGWYELQHGLLDTLLGRHRDAARHYEKAWHYRADSARHIHANAAANLALTWGWLGHPAEATSWLERHRAVDVSDGWGRHLVGAAGHLAAAQLAQDRLDVTASARHLAEVGPLTNLELWPYAAYLNASHALLDDPALLPTALSNLDTVIRTHPDTNGGTAATVMLTRARIDLLIALHQPIRAARVLDRSTLSNSALLAVSKARLQLRGGDLRRTTRTVSHTAWDPHTSHRERCELLILGALAAHRQGDQVTARRSINSAAALQTQTRMLRPFLDLAGDERRDLLALPGMWLTDEEISRIEAFERFPAVPSTPTLTGKEILLAAQLPTGRTRREIAAQLIVSEHTIRNQLAALYRKLNVNTREQARLRLEELGYYEADTDAC